MYIRQEYFWSLHGLLDSFSHFLAWLAMLFQAFSPLVAATND
jgi:hypothetical protein